MRRALRQAWWSHVAYDLLFKALAAVALLPLTSWIVSRVIESTGRLTVSNTDIAQFLLSPAGIGVAIVWLVLTLWITLGESIGHVAIAGGALTRNRVTAVDAVWILITHAPRLTWLATVLTLIVVIAVAPLATVAVTTYAVFLAQFDLYYIVTDRPRELYVAAGIIVPVAFVTAFVLIRYYIRWALVIPAAVFGRLSARDAMQESRRLVAKRWGLVARVVLLWAFVSVALPATVGAVFATAGGAVMVALGDRYSLVVLTSAVLVVSFVVALTMVSVVTLVGFNASAAGLYLRLVPSERLATQTIEIPAPNRRRPRRRVLGFAAVIASMVAIVGAIGSIHELRVDHDVQITAHRGSSLRTPENTLSALRAAIEDGAQVAEIDVQEASDGGIVLVHDSDLRRLIGDPRGIWELSTDELVQVDAGGWFAEEFAGEPIPTLEEAVRLVRDRLGLNIELKFNGHDVALAVRVVDLLRREDVGPRAVISSLDYRSLLEIRELDPEIPIGFIVASTITDVTALEVDFLAVSKSLVTRDFVRSAHRSGRQVHVWTVNDRAGMLRMIELGVDNIMTDDPALLREVLAERAALTDVEKLLLAFRNWLWT